MKMIWLETGLFAIVLSLEFSTPPDYVFSYLYIGPILLASTHASRKTTFWVTLAACIVTLLNIWLPGLDMVKTPTIASRAIATLALIVTGLLSDRNRTYQQTLLQQQARLESQEKLASVREDFASTLAHDLKTPLLGAIETLKAFQRGSFGAVESRQQPVLAMMVRSHQATLKLVETLLDVYRNDNEGLKLTLEAVDLGAIVEEVVTMVTELAASRRVCITVRYSPSNFRQFLWVKGDAEQLQRAIANLLTNAIDHSPRGERVEVILEAGTSYHSLKVLDNGGGIEPEELPHLFERFYRGQSDRQAKGSGLGLYLSRQIIDAHGGTIWAENRHPRGAIFAFRLPTLPWSDE
ncbi:HAMP domain-containing sensor histidine kinase [Oscillatoria sp. FACHB-1406]|uniref:sensor histidine kinase n=1 Tax=Oscillatoria sp. FACHB-1406 TaxID=2692846 RepID=UPI001683FAE2|nr:HAMP domain-containing sensor histidine kinase [Oscillatoria sp. FACHB-1406]MBD2577118.1 HAMP domain-containing histidine kinase [Oscillatoria sp. FACHB-1406]